jgi:hypothetical protein
VRRFNRLGECCHSAARRYQWFERISPQKLYQRFQRGRGLELKPHLVRSSCSVGTMSGRKQRYSSQHQRVFCSSKNQIDIKAEKSLSSLMSRKHLGGGAGRPLGDGHLDRLRLLIGEPGRMKEAQGCLCPCPNRTDSSCLNSSG